MTIRILVLLIAALAAGGARAQEPAKLPPFNPANYPPEVRKALHSADEECKRQGGGEATLEPDAVRKLDLSGDGRDDYIVDFRYAQCTGQKAFAAYL